MADRLRKPLSEAEFARIRAYKTAFDSDNPIIKLDALMKEEKLDSKSEELKQIYFSFYGLKPREFFSLNEKRALDIVNEMLLKQGDLPMDQSLAIEITENDPEFREMIEEHLKGRMNEELNALIKKKITETIGNKAFCPDDYEIGYEEYARRMESLSSYTAYYYQQQKE